MLFRITFFFYKLCKSLFPKAFFGKFWFHTKFWQIVVPNNFFGNHHCETFFLQILQIDCQVIIFCKLSFQYSSRQVLSVKVIKLVRQEGWSMLSRQAGWSMWIRWSPGGDVGPGGPGGQYDQRNVVSFSNNMAKKRKS